MWVDPEDGMTDDEIIEIALRKMKPEKRARLERVSEVSGRSIRELLDEALDYFEEYLENPVNRAAWLAEGERRAHPYGSDPLLRKER